MSHRFRRVLAALAGLAVMAGVGVGVADHYVPYNTTILQEPWQGLAKIEFCDPDWGDEEHPEEQGCNYYTVTREAQGAVSAKDIRGDQLGYDGAVAADQQCRFTYDHSENIGPYAYTFNRVRVRFYIPGSNTLLPVATNAAGWSNESNGVREEKGPYEIILDADNLGGAAYTAGASQTGSVTFPCGLDSDPFNATAGGAPYFGTVEVWFQLEDYESAPPDQWTTAGITAAQNTRSELFCGAEVSHDISQTSECEFTLNHGGEYKPTEVHPGYFRANVESSSTTRIEKNGGSTAVTALAAGDTSKARLDWSGVPMDEVEWFPATQNCGPLGNKLCNGDKRITPNRIGYHTPSVKAHYKRASENDPDKSATCAFDSGGGRCDASFPAVDQSYNDDQAYDVEFEFTGPNWDDIPQFQFRETGHSQPYSYVWDTTPDGTKPGTTLKASNAITIDTTGGAATTTTTTAPPGHSGGMLLGWYQGDGGQILGTNGVESIVDADNGAASFGFGHARVFVPNSTESRNRWAEGVESSSATDSVAALNAAGISASWSTKPPIWSGLDSPYARAAADTAQIDANFRSLQNSAATNSIPFNTITINHEPHDNTSDWDKKPDQAGIQAPCSAQNCAGTIAEYQALYKKLVERKLVACGTAPTYGQECDKVKVAYTGVVSNMTRSNQTGVVGSDDPLLPANRDAAGNITSLNFEVLAADPYNWGCFRQKTETGSECHDGDSNNDGTPDNPATDEHEWESFENIVDKATSNKSLLDLAVRHNKVVIITEVGSHPGCTGNAADDTTWPRLFCNGTNTNDSSWHRGTWFTAMASYLKNDAEAKRYIIAVDFYHTDHYDPVKSPDGYDWTFINTRNHEAPLDERGYDEWRTAFAADSYFKQTADGFSVDWSPNP